MSTQTLQDDPNIKLPAAVRAAAARSDEIIRQLKGQSAEGVTSEGNPETPPNDGQPPMTAETPAEPAPPKEAQPEAPKEEPKPDDQTLEQKYKSTRGRLERANEQIRELSDQVRNLQNVIATMQSAPAGASEVPDFKVERLVTDDEVRDYGEDFLKVVGKKAKEEVAPIIKKYEAKIADLERQLSGVNSVVQQDAQQKLISTLDEKLPKWRELNTNEDFLDWLRLPDPFSGAIRHEMLKAAYTQGNASRVLAFFNGFLAEEAATTPAGDEPEVGATKVPKVPLQNLAAPGRAKTAASASAPAEKPIFTRAKIAAFYADVAAGKYRGKEAEKQKLEAQIFDAQREGRIR